jgi:hypothetical protein
MVHGSGMELRGPNTPQPSNATNYLPWRKKTDLEHEKKFQVLKSISDQTIDEFLTAMVDCHYY